MAKIYKGSLSLDWYNKQKAILIRDVEGGRDGDIPAPRITWINKDEALFYEINEEEGKGTTPYWVDRNDIRVKEARPLIFKKAFKAITESKLGTLPGTTTMWEVQELKQDDPSIENILIKGDNLLSLITLKKMFANKPEEEKVKCAFLDPPYNTGAAFEQYDDNLEHSEWLTLFRDRVVAIKDLLQDGGFIFVQLDDSEGPYGKLILDEVFGRDNFVITMYVQVRYDEKTLKEDMKFNKLIEQIHIYKKNSSDRSDINRTQVEYTDEKFNVCIKELSKPSKTIKLGNKQVDIFMDGTYSIEIVKPNKKGLKEIWASGSILDGNSSGRFFRDYLTGRDKEDGCKTLYKVADIGDDGLGYRYFTGPQKASAARGKYYQGMPLDKQTADKSYKYLPVSNFIDLAAYFGNCRHEGGVEFKSGKKPEVLISKLFELSSSPGDLILDCFGGSGTSFGVAHKMGRKWIGVEIGKQADSHILPRMIKVLSGKDQTGIAKEFEWKGGGSFKYYHLGPSIIKVNRDGSSDFNWAMGQKFIEESFLSSYDYTIVSDINLSESKLFADKETQPLVGIQRFGSRSRVAVITLNPPMGSNAMLSYDELMHIYRKVKQKYAPDYVNIFTNKGIELAFDSKPDDLEVIKVPHAIFAELEK